MQRQEFTAANRASWNEAAPRHRQARFAQLLAGFAQPGYNCLDDIATGILSRIGLTDKTVAQLCCNNGRELLSIKNLGAGRCVGFDISDEFIGQAGQLASAGGIDCEFVRTDVYDISAEYDGQFDLIYISIGALGWLPDVELFFGVVARLLKPGGWLLVYEQHPVLDMFEPDDAGDPPAPRYSYFRTEPFVEQDGLDYYTMSTYESPPSYWFHHKLSDTIGACLCHGLALIAFDEYDHDISNEFARFGQLAVRLPLSYTLLARSHQDAR